MTSTNRAPASWEMAALARVEEAARAYAAMTHANLNGEPYRRREEARDRLLDALSTLDVIRRAKAA